MNWALAGLRKADEPSKSETAVLIFTVNTLG